MSGLLALLVAEAEADPQLVERLRRVLGAVPSSTGTPATVAAMRFADFALHVGVSRRHVYDLATQGLPVVGTGRARRVDVERAIAWMRDHGADAPPARAPARVDPELAPVAEIAAARAMRRRRHVP